MRIFLNKRDARGGRPHPSRRDKSRRRRSSIQSPLADLVPQQATEAPAATRRKRSDASTSRVVTFSHVAFLLAGLVIGAALMGAMALVQAQRAQQEEEAAEQPQEEVAAEVTAPAPAEPPPAQATSPAQAVRLMLKASLGGDTRTAYAQWSIRPEETAAVKSGQEISLAETTAQASLLGKTADVSKFEFRVKSQSANRAQVLQLRDGALMQTYTLIRQGPYWKIQYASGP